MQAQWPVGQVAYGEQLSELVGITSQGRLSDSGYSLYLIEGFLQIPSRLMFKGALPRSVLVDSPQTLGNCNALPNDEFLVLSKSTVIEPAHLGLPQG